MFINHILLFYFLIKAILAYESNWDADLKNTSKSMENDYQIPYNLKTQQEIEPYNQNDRKNLLWNIRSNNKLSIGTPQNENFQSKFILTDNNWNLNNQHKEILDTIPNNQNVELYGETSNSTSTQYKNNYQHKNHSANKWNNYKRNHNKTTESWYYLNNLTMQNPIIIQKRELKLNKKELSQNSVSSEKQNIPNELKSFKSIIYNVSLQNKKSLQNLTLAFKEALDNFENLLNRTQVKQVFKIINNSSLTRAQLNESMNEWSKIQSDIVQVKKNINIIILFFFSKNIKMFMKSYLNLWF